MLTESNSAVEASFKTAPKESMFGKVFQNNLDKDSFSSDIKSQLELMIKNSQTAFYCNRNYITETKEYKDCQVSKSIQIFFVIRYLIFSVQM